jgi:hypothetical protein
LQVSLANESHRQPNALRQLIPIDREGQKVSEIALQLESEHPGDSFMEILRKVNELCGL